MVVINKLNNSLLIKRANKMVEHSTGSKQNNYEELFMSKKLVKSLFIKDSDNLSELKSIYDREQPCQFYCSDCGKLVNQHLRNINFLCKDCKTKHFCLQKYGVDNPSKDHKIIEIIKEKSKKSNPERLKKYKETCMKLYGVDNTFKSEEIKQKIKKSMIKNHGVEHPLQSEVFKEKFIKTCNERFGVDYPSQNPNVRKSIMKRYTYKNIPFDSSWELAYYIYLKDNNIDFVYQPETNLWYYFNGKKHKYNPDFKIGDEIIEIKGEQFYRMNTEQFQSKLKFMNEIGVKILRKPDILPYLKYIKEKYGKNYLESFRNK